MHKINVMELVRQDFDVLVGLQTLKRKIHSELPLFEVTQTFEPRKLHYLNDRRFRFNARFFSIRKGKSELFETEGIRKIPSRFRP